jgi:hypothetical protein
VRNRKVYNFQPHTLTKAEIVQKCAFLDQFWTKAKFQPEVYVPRLPRELADFGNPPFFLFDGSQLLMRLTKEPVDRKIILAAIAHSDLRDLQWKEYFLLVQSMAAQGEDTTAAAGSHPDGTEIPSFHSTALPDAGTRLLLDLHATADQSRFLASESN